MPKKPIICFFLVTLSFIGKSQLSNSLPAYLHDFHVDPSIENTSIFNLENKFELNFHYKSFFGPLSEIKIFNTSGYFIKDKKQRFGFRVHSENEGEFFQRNRANLVYAIKTSIAKDLDMNFSSYFGGLFYRFKPSGNFQGGQDQSIDYGFALSMNYKSLKIGIAGNQMNETILRPILFEFNIRRYFEFYLENKFSLSDKWNLIAVSKHRRAFSRDLDLTHLHIRFIPDHELFSFGAHYLYDLGLSPTFGFKIPYGTTKKQFLSFNTSFFFVLNNNGVNDVFIKNQYEITLKWALKND